MSLELVAEIDFRDNIINPDGKERYSRVGLVSRKTTYYPRVIQFGDSYREIPAIPGDFSNSDTSLELDNSDGYFSALRSLTPFFNRTVRFFLTDTEEGEEDFEEVFAGKIVAWSFAEDSLNLQIADATFQKLETSVGVPIETGRFPSLADRTVRDIVPFVLGTVAHPTGAVPAYLVDPALDQDKYRYVAAQGRLKEVTKVFVEREDWPTADWSVDHIDFGGKTFTVIDFLTNVTDYPVTCNVKGITEDGTETGNPIDNPADQCEKFLLENGFEEDDLDLDSFEAAHDLFDTDNVKGGVCVAGGLTTVREVMLRFSNSFNLFFFPNREGELAISVPSSMVDDSDDLVAVKDSETIQEGGASISGPDSIATGLVIAYGHDFVDRDSPGNFLEESNVVQESRLGGKLEVALDLRFIRDDISAGAVARTRLFFMQEKRQILELICDFSLYRRVDVGDSVRVTYFGGIDFDAQGYVDAVFRVLGVALVAGSGTLLVRLRCIDLGGFASTTEGLALSAEWAKYGIPYFPMFTSYDDGLIESAEEPAYGLRRGFNDAQSQRSPTTSEVPGTPSGLTATKDGSSRVDLSWTKPGDDGGSLITGYVIEGSEGDENSFAVLGLSKTTAFAHTGLQPSTTWYYRISAVNDVGTGKATGSVSETTDAL